MSDIIIKCLLYLWYFCIITACFFPIFLSSFGIEVSGRKLIKALALLWAVTPPSVLATVVVDPLNGNTLLWQWVARGALLVIGLVAWWWSRNDKSLGLLPAMYRFFSCEKE